MRTTGFRIPHDRERAVMSQRIATRTVLVRLAPVAVALAGLLSCAEATDPVDALENDDSAVRDTIPPLLPTLPEIISEMTAAAAAFPAIAELVDLTARYSAPPSHEGRSLYAVKISDNVGLDEDEPRFLLVAAHHGNELSTTVFALDAIARLTNGYGSDSLVTRLVDQHEIWIAPIWNPDG